MSTKAINNYAIIDFSREKNIRMCLLNSSSRTFVLAFGVQERILSCTGPIVRTCKGKILLLNNIHPDYLDFLTSKLSDKCFVIENFNIVKEKNWLYLVIMRTVNHSRKQLKIIKQKGNHLFVINPETKKQEDYFIMWSNPYETTSEMKRSLQEIGVTNFNSFLFEDVRPDLSNLL